MTSTLPPLAPMSDESTLGSALAVIGKKEKRSSNTFPTRERDICHVDQRVNLMDASLKRHDYYDDSQEDKSRSSLGFSPNRSQPRRASLLERGKQFQDKLVKYMQDYSSYDVEDVEMEESQLAERKNNTLPSRDREVDQIVKPMDASLKCHEYYDGHDVDDEEPEYYCDDEEEEDDDVYANYSMGYTSTLAPSKPSNPPKTEHPDEVTKEGRAESEDFPPVKKSTLCGRYCYAIKWTILVMLFLIGAVLLLWALHFFRSYNEGVPGVPVNSPPSQVVIVSPTTTHALHATEGEIYQRKHSLEAVLEEELFPLVKEDVDLMDLGSAYAQKAVVWMTTFDRKSTMLLDQYNDFIATNHLESSATEQEDGKDRVSVKEYFDDPTHHFKTKIVDRYVEGLYYFKRHPDATPATAVLE